MGLFKVTDDEDYVDFTTFFQQISMSAWIHHVVRLPFVRIPLVPLVAPVMSDLLEMDYPVQVT